MLTELCTLSFILLLHVMVESIEDVEIFVYLGSKVTKDGGTTQDVAQRSKKQMVILYNSTQYGETVI